MTLYVRRSKNTKYVLCQEEEAEYVSLHHPSHEAPPYFVHRCAKELEGFEVITLHEPTYMQLVVTKAISYDDDTNDQFTHYVSHRWQQTSSEDRLRFGGMVIVDASTSIDILHINPWQCIATTQDEIRRCRRLAESDNLGVMSILRYDDVRQHDTNFTVLNYVTPYASVLGSTQLCSTRHIPESIKKNVSG